MGVIYWARFFREKDGRWSVDVPDLPGCLTWGETFEEAYRYLTQEAIPLWPGKDPWPQARGPEEILNLDRFEEDTEPLLARVSAARPDEMPIEGAAISAIPGLAAELRRAALAEGMPVTDLLALAAREYLARHQIQ